MAINCLSESLKYFGLEARLLEQADALIIEGRDHYQYINRGTEADILKQVMEKRIRDNLPYYQLIALLEQSV
jgi:hypothetical protein